MKRRLIYIFITVLFVVALFGTAFAAGFQQHLVQKGETLSEIAQKYKVPLKSIIQANSIKSAHRIRTGRTLRIPGETPSDLKEYLVSRCNPGIPCLALVSPVSIILNGGIFRESTVSPRPVVSRLAQNDTDPAR